MRGAVSSWGCEGLEGRHGREEAQRDAKRGSETILPFPAFLIRNMGLGVELLGQMRAIAIDASALLYARSVRLWVRCPRHCLPKTI